MTGNEYRDKLCVYGYMRSNDILQDDISRVITKFYNESLVDFFECEFDHKTYQYNSWNHSTVNITDIITSY